MTEENDTMGENGQGRRWYLVANGSRARAYVQRVGESGYDLVRSWDEPDARARDSELGEDRPGRVFASAGSTLRSGIERDAKDDSPKEHARRDFLHGLADDLVAALRAGEASGAVLIAPTPVLRQLKEEIPRALHDALHGEHPGDLTQLPTGELFERLDRIRRGI
ncbi:MAG: host attachment protein [Acetobacteraceae bacterium]|nr:host attachment protein [Acetobacteraceae bacterium]